MHTHHLSLRQIRPEKFKELYAEYFAHASAIHIFVFISLERYLQPLIMHLLCTQLRKYDTYFPSLFMQSKLTVCVRPVSSVVCSAQKNYNYVTNFEIQFEATVIHNRSSNMHKLDLMHTLKSSCKLSHALL